MSAEFQSVPVHLDLKGSNVSRVMSCYDLHVGRELSLYGKLFSNYQPSNSHKDFDPSNYAHVETQGSIRAGFFTGIDVMKLIFDLRNVILENSDRVKSLEY